MHDAALHLAFNHHGVDHAAAVVHDHVAQNFHRARARVHLDLGNVRAVGVGQPVRHEVGGSRQARGQVAGDREARRAAQRAGDLGERLAVLWNSMHVHRAVAQLEISGGDFEQLGGGDLRLLGHLGRRVEGRIACGHGLAAGIGAETGGRRGGIAHGHVDLGR